MISNISTNLTLLKNSIFAVFSFTWNSLKNFLIQIWSFLKVSNQQLYILGGILAGLFIFYQYLIFKYDARIQNSVNYLERYGSGPIAEARTYLQLYWISDDHKDILRSNKYFTPDLKKYIHKNIEKNEKYKENLHNIYLFYKDKSICALQGICDMFTSCAAFWPEMQEFVGLHGNYFSEWDSIVHRKNLILINAFIDACDHPNIIFGLEDTTKTCQLFIFLTGLFQAQQTEIYACEMQNL